MQQISEPEMVAAYRRLWPASRVWIGLFTLAGTGTAVRRRTFGAPNERWTAVSGWTTRRAARDLVRAYAEREARGQLIIWLR